MNKKGILALFLVIIILAAAAVWYFVFYNNSNTNSSTVNLTNTSTTNGRIPESADYIFILGVEPSSGSAAGGDQVTINGSGFIDGLKVHFGDAEATNVSTSGSTSISLTTPKGEGTVDVKIENPDGRSSVLYHGFTYN